MLDVNKKDTETKNNFKFTDKIQWLKKNHKLPHIQIILILYKDQNTISLWFCIQRQQLMFPSVSMPRPPKHIKNKQAMEPPSYVKKQPIL